MSILSSRALAWLPAATVTACIAGLAPSAHAQTATVTYDLNNIVMSGTSQPFTGVFQWTYTPGDFENGSGQFLTYQAPWWSSSSPALQQTIETGSIEFTMIGNYHGYGFDLTLHFVTPLSPTAPSALDLVRSKYYIEAGVGHRGTFLSGSVVPRCVLENYGSGSAGSGGLVPVITSSGGVPSLGNASFQVDCNQLLGGAGCVLLVGANQSQIAILGVTILVDPSAWIALGLQATGTQGSPGGGALQLPVPIPNNPLLVGAELDFQVLVVDPGAALGLAATDGLTMTICPGAQ